MYEIPTSLKVLTMFKLENLDSQNDKLQKN